MINRARFASCSCGLLLLIAVTVVADVPRQIHYQGKLRDSSGVSVTGAVSLRFRLYDNPNGTGTPLFDETHGAVSSSQGLFSVLIGSQTVGGLPDSALDPAEVYLGVAINGGAELSPRSRIAASPHAIMSRSAEQLVRPDTDQPAVSVDVTGNVGVGTTSPAEKLDVAGNLKAASITGLTTPLSAPQGGTGLNSPGTSGNVLTSTGSGWASSTLPAGSQWTTSGANIYYNSGNVGVGTSSPGALLDLGTVGTTRGVLRFAGNTSGNVTVQPDAAAGTWTLTLPITAGAANQFLQTNGSGVTTWAAPAATPTMKICTIFETSARFGPVTGDTGSATVEYGESGVKYSTGTTPGSYVVRRINQTESATWNNSASNSMFTMLAEETATGTHGQTYFGPSNGIQANGAGLTNLTVDHYGFKKITVGSATTWYATNGDGSAETATSIPDPGNSAGHVFLAQKNGTANIKYYIDRVLVATHTTNLPDSQMLDILTLAVSNASVSTNSAIQFASFCFEQDAL